MALFPKEVWELILEKLEDSRDLQNVFKAFPELRREGVLKARLHIWLFEQIIPHVFPWLTKPEALSCRQTCKKWSFAVDNFLENHPGRMAYSPEGKEIIGQHWAPEASSAHYKLDDSLWGHNFNLKKLTKFLEGQPQLPGGRNPFIGRYFKLSNVDFDDDDEDEYDDGLESDFWIGARDILRRIGGHIWFLKLTFDVSGPLSTIDWRERTIEILGYMPNLKGLKLKFFGEDADYEVFPLTSGELRRLTARAPLPPLPQLECLEMDSEFQTQREDHTFVLAYSATVRRLSICNTSWMPGYKNRFPQLTELTLWGSALKAGGTVRDLLLSINAPGLRRLKFKWTEWTGISPIDLSSGGLGLASILKPFPRLHSLEIVMPHIKLGGSAGASSSSAAAIDLCPSLKSFTLRSNYPLWKSGNETEMENWDLTVLRCFPSLEHFKFGASRKGSKVEYLPGLYESQVWELLPKLRELTVTGSKVFCYSRAKYEYLKEGKGKASDSDAVRGPI